MSFNTIYTQGSAINVTVPVNESIAIKSNGGLVTVNQVVGFPNRPDATTNLSTFENDEIVLGPFSAEAELEIEANAAQVLYAIGVSPVIADGGSYQSQGTPVALDVTGALTAALITGKIVTSTTAAGVTATLDTGSDMELASEFANDDSFDWSAINTGPSAFTVTANTDHTIVGDGAVAAGTSGIFRTRRTASGVFVTYRIG